MLSALILPYSFLLLMQCICTSGYANFTATFPTSLNADITTIYRAVTVNGDTINHLAQRQEDLKQESEFELDMKATLELEVKRLEESLAIHNREIKNMGIREGIRQYELAELKDLGLVMLVQALREEMPEEWRTETSNGDELLEERSESQSQES
jgi:hypothetical protein